MTVFRSYARRVAHVVASYQVAAISALVVAIVVGTLSTDITASLSHRFLVAEGDCGSEPSWPDCAEKSCSSGNWTCTRMKEGSSNGGGGGCSGSPPTSTSWCNGGTWQESTGGGYTGGSGGGCATSPGGCGGYTGGNYGGSGGGSNCSVTFASCSQGKSGTEYEACETARRACEGSGGGYTTGGGSYSGGGGGPGSYSYWSQTLGYTIFVWNKGDCDAKLSSISDATKRNQEIQWCYQALSGTPGGTDGGMGYGGGADPREQWIMNCMSTQSKSRPDCATLCEKAGSGCPSSGGGYGTTGGNGNTGGSGGGSSMQRCFYTDAKINGKHPGFSIWCERDYQNCHKESPSGPIVSMEGLQLGAPSQCESGWNGGGYGSTGGYGYGGSTGGGQVQCCPHCDPGKPCSMVACMSYASPAQAPQGWDCKPMGGGYGGTGYGGGNSYGGYGGAGFGGDEGNTYAGGGFGDHMQMAPPPGMGGDQQDFERQKKDSLRNLSQREREVKDMERSYRDGRMENPTLKSQIEQFRGMIGTVSQCMQKATDWDTMQKCQDIERDLGDLTQEIWNMLQAGNVSQDLKRMEKELGNMQREITRLEKANKETTTLNQILEEIKNTAAEVSGLLTSDPQEAQYAMQDLRDLQQKFWDNMQVLQQEEHMKEFGRFLKEGCRDFEREAKRTNGPSRKNAEGILRECKELVAQTQADLASGQKDPQEVGEDFRWAMEDLWGQFHESMEVVWSENDCRSAERGLEEAGRAIQSEAPRIIDQVRDTHPSIAAQMETLLEKAEAILKQGEDALAHDNCDHAIDAVDTLHDDISQRFDDLMRKAGMSVEDFEGGYDNEYNDFYNEFEFDDFDADEFDTYLTENEYDMNTLSLAKRIAGNIIAQYLKGQKDSGAPDLISTAADLGIPALELQKLLEVKNSLLAEIDALRASVQSLKGELASIADKLAQFTFGEETGEEAEKFLTEELPFLTPEEAEARFAELQDDARREFVENGTAPYLDVQPFEGHGWFADSVANMTEAGLFTGVGDGEFAPEKEANVAEVVTTFARALEVDESGAEPVSDLAGDMPQWAEEPAAGLEEVLADQGEDLSNVFEGSPGDAVTRLEVARLINAVYADSFDETSGTEVLGGYTDLGGLSPEDREAVATVVSAEIMTGTDHEWNPDKGFNRAQFATVMDRLAEATGEFGHEDEDYDYEEDEEGGSDYGGELAPEDEGSAYQSDEEEHSAAEESLSSEEAQAPAYYYDLEKVTGSQISELMEGALWYQSEHKDRMKYGNIISTIKADIEILTTIVDDYTKFQKLYPGVKTWTVNLCNKFVGEETDVFLTMLKDMGRPGKCYQ